MIAPRTSKDHKAWLAYWSEEVLRALRRAIVQSIPEGEDYELLHVVRCARILHHRAIQAHPRLAPRRDERHKEERMKVHITPNDKGNPPGKLADAELHFTEGPLEGLKLIGFSIWERRGGGGGRNVTFPARQYSVNGERRSFALLRPVVDTTAQNRIRDLILEAYAAHEAVQS